VSSALVHNLQASIVLENVEDGPVRLPEEFEPRRNDGTVGTVFGLFSRNCREENGLWSLGSLEIVDICTSTCLFIDG
jgi:hypothetical protein